MPLLYTRKWKKPFLENENPKMNLPFNSHNKENFYKKTKKPTRTLEKNPMYYKKIT